MARDLQRGEKMSQTILIADDERGIVDMLKAYFSPEYEILTAYSGQEAMQRAEAQPDLILLDINMPGMDGLTVCHTIREHVTCPILFLTARVESADQIMGFQAGAWTSLRRGSPHICAGSGGEAPPPRCAFSGNARWTTLPGP